MADLSRDQLVRRIADPALTVRKIARFELGDARPTDAQIATLAKACDVPIAFFTVDFTALDNPIAALSARVDEVTAQLKSLKALVVASSQGAMKQTESSTLP